MKNVDIKVNQNELPVIETNKPIGNYISFALVSILPTYFLYLSFGTSLNKAMIVFWFFCEAISYFKYIERCRLYLFYNERIIIKAPFSFIKTRSIEITQIKTITYSGYRGFSDFNVELKNTRNIIVLPFNSWIFDDNYFNSIIDFFREKDIPLFRAGLFGRKEPYDPEYDAMKKRAMEAKIPNKPANNETKTMTIDNYRLVVSEKLETLEVSECLEYMMSFPNLENALKEKLIQIKKNFELKKYLKMYSEKDLEATTKQQLRNLIYKK